MIHRLSMNENGFATKINVSLSKTNCAEYPLNSIDLLRSISNKTGVEIEKITLTAGIDDAIFLFLNYLLLNKKKLLLSTPNYCGILDSVKALGVNASFYEQPEYEFDLELLKSQIEMEHDIDAVYLCNPRNPFGSSIDQLSDVLDFLSEKGILVFLDEAYAEFLLFKNLKSKYVLLDNLVIARTFSKAYGLAGIRCGYIITGNEAFTKYLSSIEKVKPYKLPFATLKMAESAICDEQRLDTSIKNIVKNKHRIYRLFDKYQITYFKSYTNFVTFKVENPMIFINEMMENDIELKELSEFGANGLVRVSVVNKQSIDLFIEICERMWERNV